MNITSEIADNVLQSEFEIRRRKKNSLYIKFVFGMIVSVICILVAESLGCPIVLIVLIWFVGVVFPGVMYFNYQWLQTWICPKCKQPFGKYYSDGECPNCHTVYK
jgi:predicted neutral ceramidase superfamily lipid hydrolase